MSTGEEGHMAERGTGKRRVGTKNGGKGKKKKKLKTQPASSDRSKVSMKSKKLFQKRARDYNSDDDEDEDESTKPAPVSIREKIFSDANMGPNYDEIEEEEGSDKDDNSDGEDHGEIQSGITRFATDDGCNAFRVAFKAIMKKTKGEDALGPVLSAHKHLIGQKLAEEEAERKAKGQARKAKHLVAEKGHVKPASYLDSHEKILIGVATKGVVKLFNAVNKAQHAQKGLNASRSKDAKELKKRRKDAFFTELGKTPKTETKAQKSSNSQGDEAPAWAPLRDNYMLANQKLKDWDKKQETNEGDDFGAMSDESYED
uniref:RRP15-like protein n=1 Tax=Noccaea caerulescens TaxID=107243 RepID=A0A1J3IIH3_NOCCA